MAETKKTKKAKKVVERKSATQILREKDVETLEKEIEDLKKELFNLRWQAAVGKLKDTSAIAKARKGVAQRLTILTERANAKEEK